ncbi:hypothetical protein L195_g017242, partial [Trifolium pratense]
MQGSITRPLALGAALETWRPEGQFVSAYSGWDSVELEVHEVEAITLWNAMTW